MTGRVDYSVSFTVTANRRVEAEKRARVTVRNYFGEGVDYDLSLSASPTVLGGDGTILSWEVAVDAWATRGTKDGTP